VCGWSRMVKLLLYLGTPVLSIDARGRSLLHYAAEHFEQVRLVTSCPSTSASTMNHKVW
jgi:hypothetical protein